MLSRRVAAVLIALVAGAACGGERSPATSALQTQGDALLTVTNDYWLDAVVYAVQAGTRQRIGTVAGFSSDTLPLRRTMVGAGSIRLLVEPIGSSTRHVTEPVHVDPGDMVDLRIGNPLNLSSITVWRP